jgi:hypothetical protein
VGYFVFEGEQHRFQRAENIKRALDAELYFYAMLICARGSGSDVLPFVRARFLALYTRSQTDLEGQQKSRQRSIRNALKMGGQRS